MNEGSEFCKTNSEIIERQAKLVKLIADLDERGSTTEISKMLDAGYDPQGLLDSCLLGMKEVGTRFENGRYFIAALIMAGDIMRQITKMLAPHLSLQKKDNVSGTLLLGTVEGDMHDLGKNLVAILANCYGIEVVDLGVNVKSSIFLKEALERRPNVIGISCILSTCWQNLEKTVNLLHKELPKPQPSIIIGGCGVDQRISQFVKSDYWVRDASEGVKYCLDVMKK